MTRSSPQSEIEIDVESFLKEFATHPHYRAPRGAQLHALSWQTEAPLRMLLNNLDAEVAEDPDHLIIYGGTGQAARNPEAVQKILKKLFKLKEDESLLIQSGKPIGVVKTTPQSPQLLSPIAISFPIGPPGNISKNSRSVVSSCLGK